VSPPVWLLAPAWYDGRSRRVLDDTLFAQYCLFLTIRIHDDLLDSQANESWLILAADDLIIEAQGLFARHIEGRPFWSLFRNAMRRTLTGIAEVDRLQCQPRGMPASARQLYGDVASVLSIGVGATLARTNRLGEFSMFERFAADLAIAGQLLDDLADVEEDAKRGRLNAAATLLIGSDRMARRCRQEAVRRKTLARRILLDGRAMAVLDLARAHALRASRTAARMQLAEGVDHANGVADSCAFLADRAHRAQFDQLGE